MQSNIFLPITLDSLDYYKIIPFEIEYSYKHSAPYYYEGMNWIEYNFNGIKTPFKVNAWEDFNTYWNEEYYNESLERITYENINPYFEAYHKGFMSAYFEYEELTKNAVSLFGNTNTYANKVFDDAMKQVHGAGYKGDWIDEKRVKVLVVKDWHEIGLLAGKNYKAWYLILNNHREFVPLFRESKLMINFYKVALMNTKEISLYTRTRDQLLKLINEIEPNTDQSEDKGNEVDRNIIDEVNGRDCVEFDKLFPSIKAKNEVWGYMETLNIIDNYGNIAIGTRQKYLLAFIRVMRKHQFINNLGDRPLSETFNLKLGGKKKRISCFNDDDVINIVAILNRIEEKNAPKFTI